MSMEKPAVSEAGANPTPWTAWRKSVTNTEPEAYGPGKVLARGLYYLTNKNTWATIWEENLDQSLDKFQQDLNAQGLCKIHRLYRFEFGAGTKFPGRTTAINGIATATKGWSTRLQVGEMVEMMVWREGEYTQIGFKKA